MITTVCDFCLFSFLLNLVFQRSVLTSQTQKTSFSFPSRQCSTLFTDIFVMKIHFLYFNSFRSIYWGILCVKHNFRYYESNSEQNRPGSLLSLFASSNLCNVLTFQHSTLEFFAHSCLPVLLHLFIFSCLNIACLLKTPRMYLFAHHLSITHPPSKNDAMSGIHQHLCNSTNINWTFSPKVSFPQSSHFHYFSKYSLLRALWLLSAISNHLSLFSFYICINSRIQSHLTPQLHLYSCNNFLSVCPVYKRSFFQSDPCSFTHEITTMIISEGFLKSSVVSCYLSYKWPSN